MAKRRRRQSPVPPPAWTPFVPTGRSNLQGGVLYENSRYLVWKRHCGRGEWGNLWHLSIRNLANTAEHDWRDYQRIKNELVGPEAEGVELYPGESRKVDAANQYHLWVVEGAGYRFPFGFGRRLVTDKPMEGGAQRPFEEDMEEDR